MHAVVKQIMHQAFFNHLSPRKAFGSETPMLVAQPKTPMFCSWYYVPNPRSSMLHNCEPNSHPVFKTPPLIVLKQFSGTRAW